MYIAKVRGLFLSRKYKCKGHTVLKESGHTMLILENEERVFIPSRYIIEFSRGWFEMEVENVKRESMGQAVINK